MKLKKWVKVALIIMVTAIMFWLLYLNNRQEKQSISNCINKGYTQSYCEEVFR